MYFPRHSKRSVCDVVVICFCSRFFSVCELVDKLAGSCPSYKKKGLYDVLTSKQGAEHHYRQTTEAVC